MNHQIVAVNGIRLHVVEEGEGPLVLLVHGFPESWYSWRHQLPALAAAGYRAVAIDVRGYGRSSAPPPSRTTGCCATSPTTSPSSARSARSRPSSSVTTGARRSRGTRPCCGPTCSAPSAGLSVPFAPAGDTRPTDAFRRWRRRGVLHRVLPAARAGRAGARRGRPRWLLGLLLHGVRRRPAAAGGGTVATIPHGALMRDRFAYPDPMPAWLSDEDLDVYAGGVRAHRVHRRAQPLPQRRSRLGGPRRVPGPADRGAGAVRRRRP